MEKWREMDKDFLIQEINNSSSFNEASKRIGYARCRKDIIKKIAVEYGLDIDRFIALNTSRAKTTQVGDKYGKWTVIEDLKTNAHGTRLFLCECECGHRSKVLGPTLRKGLSTSCGKCNQPKINQRFGRLVVLKEDIEREEKERAGKSFWLCQCDCGNIISILQTHFKVQQSCGCLKSKSNARIECFLRNKNIPYQKEYNFSDLRGEKGGVLKFDFAVFDENGIKFLIEYQGKQHYESSDFFGGEEKFRLQQKYDNMKKEYCKRNNIQLLIISYWEKDIEKIIEEFYYV